MDITQAFTRLGTRVTVIDMNDTILSKDDPELTAMLRKRLAMEGVGYVLEDRSERDAGR